MAENSSIIIIVLILCFFCMSLSLIVAGGSWYENWTCSLGFGYSCSSTSSNSNTSTSTSTSALQSLIAKGTILKTAETDLGTSPIAPDNQPSITLTSTPAFSMSFWVSAPTGTSTAQWLSVFGGNGLDISYDSKPELAISLANAQPPPASVGPKNWVYAGVPFGTSVYHIVWVVNGMSVNTYKNGVKEQVAWGYSETKTPIWLDSTVNMNFNPDSKPMTGIKVKSCYWFNSQLSDADVNTLYSEGS